MPSDTRGNATNAPVGLTRGWARFLQAPIHKKITMKVALGGEVCFQEMIPVTLEKTRCNVVSVLVHEN